MIKVAPSILSADFGKMAEAVQNIEKWGADWVHCDVMDGVYVPNITFGMPMVKALRKYTDMFLDVHLMITRPEKYVGQFCDAGADLVTFHPEASEDVKGALNEIKSKGVKCGLVVNADQPFSVAEQFTGMQGKYVPIKETVRGFKEILEGKHDDLPESAFLFVGTIDEAVEKAKQGAAK